MQVDTVVINCRYGNKCIYSKSKYSNALLTELLLDSAKSGGALTQKRKPAFEPRNDWVDNDCQMRRGKYRRKLREANKTSNHCERKAAAKNFKLYLLQKKNKWESDTNQLLHQKNT